MAPAAAALLLLLGSLGSLPDAGAGGGQLLDRIVAMVDRQPLLLSQLELEARVAFISQGGTEAATAPLTEADLAAALDWAIGQRLALAEADRLQVFDVEEADVAKAIKAFEGRFAGEKALQSFLDAQGVTLSEVAAVLRRDLRVSRFLDSKVKLSARVSDEDLRRYWAAHADELADQPFERARELIKERLTRERYRVLAQRQLNELRAKADVRSVATFSPAPSSGGDAGSPQP